MVDDRPPPADGLGGKVGRPNDAVGGLQGGDDVALAIDVVAHRHGVHAGLEELLEYLRGKPAAACGVFGVADHQVDVVGLDEVAEAIGQHLPPRASHHVAHAQNVDRHRNRLLARP